MQFEVQELSPTTNKVVMTGRLDAAGVAICETAFTGAVAASGRSAVLDLTNLTFMSSLGIRMLLSCARVVTRRGGKVVLFGAQPIVAEVLTAMALDGVLPLVGTEEEARATLGA